MPYCIGVTLFPILIPTNFIHWPTGLESRIKNEGPSFFTKIPPPLTLIVDILLFYYTFIWFYFYFYQTSRGLCIEKLATEIIEIQED